MRRDDVAESRRVVDDVIPGKRCTTAAFRWLVLDREIRGKPRRVCEWDSPVLQFVHDVRRQKTRRGEDNMFGDKSGSRGKYSPPIAFALNSKNRRVHFDVLLEFCNQAARNPAISLRPG